MKWVRIELERALRSRSANIIWTLLSSPEGMAKWLADDVRQDGETLTFTWGNPRGDHETRTATVLGRREFSRIRFRWDDDGYEGTFVELGMVRSDLTGDYTLVITDFAPADDLDSLRDIWDSNVEALRRRSGL